MGHGLQRTMPTIDAHFSNWCAKEYVLVGSSGSGSGGGGGVSVHERCAYV